MACVPGLFLSLFLAGGCRETRASGGRSDSDHPAGFVNCAWWLRALLPFNFLPLSSWFKQTGQERMKGPSVLEARRPTKRYIREKAHGRTVAPGCPRVLVRGAVQDSLGLWSPAPPEGRLPAVGHRRWWQEAG